ncbi:MAG: PD-(D/E)XK nuclease family protein, partial [Actinomycetota bacterium]|nr:PD-(D/E)XK nuclease family protein [Actinomycetota bacterium]
DIEGFVRFLRDQEAAGAKEVEAAAEEEGADAVRLLTVHGAKGLEFKVVVLADAGRTPPSPSPDEILCLPDGRFGFRVLNPATGKRTGAFGWEEVREAERSADQAENRRLLYVAMTRAIDRLIISGAVDPGTRRDGEAPLRWILSRLELDLGGNGPAEIERGEARVLLRIDRGGDAEKDEESAPAGESQLQLFTPMNGGAARQAPELPELLPVPVPPTHRIRSLSYSALAVYSRCSYRFYAERIVGLSPADAAGTVPGATEGLAATELGDAVHVLLETDTALEDAREQVLRRYPGATVDDLARVDGLVRAWRESPLAGRLAALDGVRQELSFAFEHDGVLLHGRFDVFHVHDGRALVIDYKTNRLDESSPEETVAAEYVLQRLVYALAALRAGAQDVEVAYVFLERPDQVVTATFARDDVPALEAELSEAIRTIQEGDFRPTPSEYVCPGCPALDVVCAGPRLLAPAFDGA